MAGAKIAIVVLLIQIVGHGFTLFNESRTNCIT